MFFALGRFWDGLVLGRTIFHIPTALVESSDDAMMRRLRLEDFHVSGERVIEVDLCSEVTMVVQDVACPRLCKCLRPTVPKPSFRLRRPDSTYLTRISISRLTIGCEPARDCASTWITYRPGFTSFSERLAVKPSPPLFRSS